MADVGKFYGPLVYFTAITNILWPLGIFCVYFGIFCVYFGIFCVYFGIFFPVSACCTKSGNPISASRLDLGVIFIELR
jgi:hypothetical protein